MRRTCEEVFPNSLNGQPNQENINHYNEIEMSALCPWIAGRVSIMASRVS